MDFWAPLSIALLLAACGGEPAVTEPAETPTASAGDEAPRAARIPDADVPEDEAAWLEGDVADAAQLAEDYPADPRARYRAGRLALSQGDLEGAERHLRAGQAMVEADSELSWRLRARLAEVLARTERREEAREVAGLMCQGPDSSMTPAYMRPLLADLEERSVCGGLCAQALACCHAYIREVAGASTISPREACQGVEQVAESPNADQVCQQLIDGWRQAIESMPNQAVPAACRS